MEEYGKNYYRNLYKSLPKERLIEKIIEQMEQISTQVNVESDSFWISEYKRLSGNCYLLEQDLVEQNQQLKKMLEEKEGIIKDLIIKNETLEDDNTFLQDKIYGGK